MDSSLLTVKLQIPRQPPHAIQRPRLIDTLESGISHYKLILLPAPAGYGKTTLLAQWARASRFPVVWLSMGEEDNDFDRFLRYLVTGWEGVQPGLRESPLDTLLGAISPDREAVLSAFVNAASEAPGQVVFILDDYHLIEEESIHQTLTFLLDHLPRSLHFVLAGRGEPPLPLARYRARSQMLELRAGELRFLPDETVDFLNEGMGLDLDLEEVKPLNSRLEGWIAGLQLAALAARRGCREADKLVVSGRHRFIADYLDEDVLAQLPDDIRQFLLRSSILERMSGSLCESVTGVEDGHPC